MINDEYDKLADENDSDSDDGSDVTSENKLNNPDDIDDNDIEDNDIEDVKIKEEDEDEDKEEDEDEDKEEGDDEDKDEDESSQKLNNDYLSDINYKNIFSNNDIIENVDSMEFLQKFNNELKEDYILNYHNECLHKNQDEISKLLKVVKNKDNIIIDEFHKTNPLLTKYEKTKILGIRLKQLNNNAKPYINVKENIIDNLLIASLELEQKKLPFIIQRPLPNNCFEYWKLEDLEII
jgi:DNA-directed RNA polymerase subunit K/omega